MSELIVEVVRIDEVSPHPDPEVERLEVAKVKGWQVVVPKGQYHDGDVCIYVPPDAMLGPEVADHWGVTKYLGSNGRVRSVRLRGAMSFGFLAEVESMCGDDFLGIVMAEADDRAITWWEPQVGDDVASYYGITKWEPPVTFNTAELEPEHRGFIRYTDIQLYENYPDVISVGEEVVITEKIHGTNSRVAILPTGNDDDPTLMVCGTHNNQVRRGINSVYEEPLKMESVTDLLADLYAENPGRGVILYGELYGMQSLKYGLQRGAVGFRAFDIAVGGEMIDWDDMVSACEGHGVPMVPVLYRGPFDPDVLRELSGGNTTIGGDHIREGVVVHPVIERRNYEGRRTMLKRISDQYRLKADRISDSH